MMIKDDAVMPTDGLRFSVDWASRLARHDMIWGDPYGPPSDWRHGAPLGNGDLGAMVYGSPDNLSFALGKNGLWDRHHDGRSTFKGTSFNDVFRVYREQDREAFGRLCAEPEPADLQHATTAGMFRLHLHDGDGTAAASLRLSLYDALARLTFTPAGIVPGLVFWGQTQATMLVSRAYGVVAIRVRPTTVTLDPVRQWCPTGRPAPLGVVTWELSRANHPPHPDAVVSVGPHTSTLTQKLAYGDEYTLAIRFVGGEMASWSAGDRAVGRIDLRGGVDDLLVLLTVVTRQEHDNPSSAAVARLDRAVQAGFDAILAQHTAWWHDYWQRGYVLCDEPAIERSYFVSLYYAGSMLDPKHVSPGLQGPWIKENVPAWLGDYHSNVNLQSVYWGLLANNRVAFMQPLARCLQRMEPQARRDTERYFGMAGLRLPHAGSVDGFELTYGDWATNLGVSVGGSAWLTQLLWQMYEYTLDSDFLHDIAWPMLRDVAVFYENYLQWDQAQGCYALEPSVFFESRCPQFECWGKNSLYELSLVYGAMLRAIHAAEAVSDADSARHAARWRDVVAKLPSLPTDRATDSWISFEGRDTRDVPTHFFVLPPVFPGELVSAWHGPEVWRRQAMNTLNHPMTANSGTGGAWCGGQGIRELIRLGLVDRAFAALREQNLFKDQGNPNGLGHTWSSAYLQADHAPGLCSVLADMMLLTTDGCLRLFPCWPDHVPAAFHSLRAPGAFLVSAERRSGEVNYAFIQSLAGSQLRLANPWQGVAVIDDAADGRVVLVSDQAILQLTTVPGQRLRVRREGDTPQALPIKTWA